LNPKATGVLMAAGARSFPPAHLSHNNITAIPGQPQTLGLITLLGVEREQRCCFAERPNSPDLWSDPMNRTNEFLSPKQGNKLGKSALLMPPLRDVQFSFDIKDLTPHQDEYWKWWVHRMQLAISRSYENDDVPVLITDIAEEFSYACKWELEIIRTISDMALELRRMRLSINEEETDGITLQSD